MSRKLLVALHGYASNGYAMADALRSVGASDVDLALFAPDGQQHPQLTARGRAWYQLTSAVADMARRSVTVARVSHGAVAQAQQSYRIGPDRTVVVGFSQGATVALALVGLGGVVNRGVFVCGRLPLVAMPEAPLPNLLAIVGANDRFAQPAAVRRDIARYPATHRPRLVVVPGLGHEFRADVARMALGFVVTFTTGGIR